MEFDNQGNNIMNIYDAFGCIWNHLDALVFCRNRASITEAAVRANLLSSRIAVDTHVDL